LKDGPLRWLAFERVSPSTPPFRLVIVPLLVGAGVITELHLAL
jgi:hypothetical protein